MEAEDERKGGEAMSEPTDEAVEALARALADHNLPVVLWHDMSRATQKAWIQHARALLCTLHNRGFTLTKVEDQKQRLKHLVRGTTYTNEWLATAQCEEPIKDNDPVVVYRSEKDGRVWVRPPHEFPGRFEVLPPKTEDQSND